MTDLATQHRPSWVRLSAPRVIHDSDRASTSADAAGQLSWAFREPRTRHKFASRCHPICWRRAHKLTRPGALTQPCARRIESPLGTRGRTARSARPSRALSHIQAIERRPKQARPVRSLHRSARPIHHHSSPPLQDGNTGRNIGRRSGTPSRVPEPTTGQRFDARNAELVDRRFAAPFAARPSVAGSSILLAHEEG